MILFGLGSLISLGLKLGSYNLLVLSISPWLAYAMTLLMILLTSYLYHRKISFRGKLSAKSFMDYSKLILLFLTLDYIVFQVALVVLNLSSVFSILTATACIFIIRFFAVKTVMTDK